MSRTMHIVGFMPPEDEWKKMKAVWDACVAAKVEIPLTVGAYFGGSAPDDNGRGMVIPYRRYDGDMSEGFEIDVDKLPPGVKTVRFYVSY